MWSYGLSEQTKDLTQGVSSLPKISEWNRNWGAEHDFLDIKEGQSDELMKGSSQEPPGFTMNGYGLA